MQRRALAAGLSMVAGLVAASPASAAGKADMEVTRVAAEGISVACAEAGCSLRLTASARVVNDGAKRAGRAKVGFFLSQNARRDGGDASAGRQWMPAIGSDRRRSMTAMLFATDIAPGTYRLLACADVTRRVRETNEGNNCRATAGFPVGGAQAPQPQPQPQPQPAGPCTESGWRSALCAEIGQGMASGLFGDMADVLTFALLYQHYFTRQAILPSVAAGVIEPYRTAWDPVRGQAGVATYRISGFLDFWVNGAYGGLDWSRYPDRFDTPEEFASWWQTYGQVQWTARQNAINHSLNAIVQSELAWRSAMDDWKAYDLRLVTAQQYSDATVFAHRTLEDAQTAVMRAQNAVIGPP
jgi:hypothetical protein